MRQALTGKRILIVEDEYYIAHDLKRALLERSVDVVGPVGNLAAGVALARSEMLDGAVLDVNLDGDFSFPIADLLTEAAVPHVFVTGYDGWALPAAYRSHPRVSKPFPIATVVEMVERICGAAP